MRFKLLRRRLTISAPRMKVRSAMPWPLQWAAAAIVLGFCGAIGLWAFELGKELAGVDHDAREELARRVHMDTSSLWKIENGKTLEPRPSTIRKLAEALGVPVSEIAKPDEAA